MLLCSLALEACRYAPHAHLLTITEPSRENVIGVYVADRFDLPPELVGKTAEITVELHRDGTFTATNVPPRSLYTPKPGFFESLLNREGDRWEIGTMGTLDPGAHPIWGVYLHDEFNRLMPASFTGQSPPYGLVFQLGDPDSGYAILLKKKS